MTKKKGVPVLRVKQQKGGLASGSSKNGKTAPGRKKCTRGNSEIGSPGRGNRTEDLWQKETMEPVRTRKTRLSRKKRGDRLAGKNGREGGALERERDQRKKPQSELYWG